MASSMVTSSQSPTPPRPNLAFRRLRGQRSPAEFAAAVRRAAREIGESVSCDARYVGRVEAGEIRCPNYAYERVFLHMFPGRTLTDLGFASRASVRGRRARTTGETPGTYEPYDTQDTQDPDDTYDNYEESDVLRRAFMTGGGATVAAASLGPLGLALDATAAGRPVRRAGTGEAGALEEAVRRIRLLDDRHGADGLYQRAAAPLRAAYALLDAGATRQTTADRLHSGAGELAISVGWLAHDSGRFDDARSHYAEALATARVTGDDALEAHAFCNTAFLARDSGRPREAVRAAQAAQRVARPLGSPRLMSLLALREAGGWAGLADRTGCEQALARAQAYFERGLSDADPEWMSFYGEAELEGLEAQCWSTLGDWRRAARHARRAAHLQDPHFTRNIALYTAELADDLARGGQPDEAAAAGLRVLELLGEVQSSRVRTMLAATARVLLPHRRASGVSAFLERHASLPRTA
ncbi:tetratricopeptide repeat protein [Streptomyces sp. NPDC091972]|uniref:tetratricopeptide repeat protein n=1 Tax=unclassified Streptomyces TaxID=2593676 RepID=UPI00341B053F